MATGKDCRFEIRDEMQVLDTLNLTQLVKPFAEVEVVERKGIGHPDTICDSLAENLSRSLCRYYVEHFGTVLHHNVDKALLCAGQTTTRFGGGTVDVPFDIYLAGRAVTEVGGHVVPIEKIANEVAHSWLADNLHSLNPQTQVRVHSLIRRGSSDLEELFERSGSTRMARANDTSIGVGYAPLSTLETIVLQTERELNRRIRSGESPAWGEDIKVMGARTPVGIDLTVSCALIDQYIEDIPTYLAEKDAIANLVRQTIGAMYTGRSIVTINAADDPGNGSIFLTVTGTSAEAGDDGEVGRGNRANGLITPYRPMSLEASAGKNPVSHVGKLYNAVASNIANALVAGWPEISEAECYLLSRIGDPIAEPSLIDVRIGVEDSRRLEVLSDQIRDVVDENTRRIPEMVDEFIEGHIEIV